MTTVISDELIEEIANKYLRIKAMTFEQFLRSELSNHEWLNNVGRYRKYEEEDNRIDNEK